jgi:hypothetical protein
MLSCPAGKGKFKCEMRAIEASSKILGRLRQTRRMLMEESSKSLSSTLDKGHEGRIREVLQEDGHSSMSRVMIT